MLFLNLRRGQIRGWCWLANGVILEGRRSSVLIVRFLVRGKQMCWLEMSQWCVKYHGVFPKDVYDLYFIGIS